MGSHGEGTYVVGDVMSKPASELEPGAPEDSDKIQDPCDASRLESVVLRHCEKPAHPQSYGPKALMSWTEGQKNC